MTLLITLAKLLSIPFNSVFTELPIKKGLLYRHKASSWGSTRRGAGRGSSAPSIVQN